MEEELKAKLIESLDSVTQYVNTTKDFVAEQSPLVVQEMLNAGYLEASSHLLFNVTIFITFLTALIFARKSKLDNSDKTAASIFSVIGIALSFSLAFVSIYNLLYIYFCPRLYVIETISDLIR